MVDLLGQHSQEGRRFEPTECIEDGSRVAVRLTVSDPAWQGEPATDVFKVFTFSDADGGALLMQDCTGREDALAYLAAD